MGWGRRAGAGAVTAAHLRLGQLILNHNQTPAAPERAINHFNRALHPPASLGEAWHLLASCSNIYFWLGEAFAASAAAASAYERSAAQLTDFRGMAVQPFSDQTYWSGLSLQRLGHIRRAKELFEAMREYGTKLAHEPVKIDYFATSLPTLLLFEDDLHERQEAEAALICSIASAGLSLVGASE